MSSSSSSSSTELTETEFTFFVRAYIPQKPTSGWEGYKSGRVSAEMPNPEASPRQREPFTSDQQDWTEDFLEQAVDDYVVMSDAVVAIKTFPRNTNPHKNREFTEDLIRRLREELYPAHIDYSGLLRVGSDGVRIELRQNN